MTVALSLLELNEGGLTGRFDARTPLCAIERFFSRGSAVPGVCRIDRSSRDEPGP